MKFIDLINQKEQRATAPYPNEVDSQYVLECLATGNEGDGMLFAALFEKKLLYATSNDSWYVWCGNVWRRDKTNLVLCLVRYVAERYGQEIKALEGKIENSRKENDSSDHKIFKDSWNRKITLLQNKIKALRQENGRNACVKFSYTHLGNQFAIEGNEFDRDPWLLGVKNGVVDLRSGELYPGEPLQLVSKQCSCNFHGLDNCSDLSNWEHFLDTIYDGDKEKILFMQMLLGYGLTGLTTEHVFPFLLGRGRNGKSLFIATIMRVMGDYAAMVPCEIFLKSKYPRSANQTDPAVMKHEGLRLAVSSEIEEGSLLSGQQVKRMTGGDTLEGRTLYDRELRNFKPTHLSIMIANHEPVPPTGDLAFWDRTFLVDHPVRFVKDDPDPAKNEKLADPEIEQKLCAMDEQALCWMIEGCLLWQANGKKLTPPASVLKVTRDYQADADWIGQFIDACCERTASKTGATTLYLAFVEWYKETIDSRKNKVPSQRVFGQKLKAHGEFDSGRSRDGIYYSGITLNYTWQNKLLQVQDERE